MTSATLRKCLIAGAALAALTVGACNKSASADSAAAGTSAGAAGGTAAAEAPDREAANSSFQPIAPAARPARPPTIKRRRLFT